MPSEKILEQKKLIVDELADKLSDAISGVLIDYRGITVEQDTELRNQFRAAGVEYSVIKNTLTRLACNKVGLDDLDDILHGPTSLAISNTDAVAPAKVISEYIKKNDKISIKSGFVEGKVISANEIKALADIPSKEVLYAQLLYGLNSPITGLVTVLNGTIRSLVLALNAIAEKQGQSA